MNDLLKKKCIPCEGGTPPLNKEETEKYLGQVSDWLLSADAKKIYKEFKFKDFIGAINFINKIASYKKVISIPNSVTLIEDLWPTIEKLIEVRPTGILNLTNEGYVEHKAILSAYKKFVDPNHTYTKITLAELEGPGGITKAKRSNCILSTRKAESLGISMPKIDDAKIAEVMKKFKASLNAII